MTTSLRNLSTTTAALVVLVIGPTLAARGQPPQPPANEPSGLSGTVASSKVKLPFTGQVVTREKVIGASQAHEEARTAAGQLVDWGAMAFAEAAARYQAWGNATEPVIAATLSRPTGSSVGVVVWSDAEIPLVTKEWYATDPEMAEALSDLRDAATAGWMS